MTSFTKALACWITCQGYRIPTRTPEDGIRKESTKDRKARKSNIDKQRSPDVISPNLGFGAGRFHKPGHDFNMLLMTFAADRSLSSSEWFLGAAAYASVKAENTIYDKRFRLGTFKG